MKKIPRRKRSSLIAFLILTVIFAVVLIADLLWGRPAAPETPASPSVPPATPSPATAPKIAVGYYASWSAGDAFTPDQIAADKLDFIHYAFAQVGADHKIALGQPELDTVSFEQLRALKVAHPKLKTLISIGGWGGSEGFSEAAASDEARRSFAESCAEFVRINGFDGVDIDWEYPVSGGSPGKPEDRENFTRLMQALREALDRLGAAEDRHFFLSFAGGATDSYVQNVELQKLAAFVDYAVIMTYDLHGKWDAYADLNAPLYTPTEPSPQYKASVDDAVRAWKEAGFPPEKTVMGLAFYGYIYSGVSAENNGLYQSFAYAKTIAYDGVEALLSDGGYSVFRHAQAQVPYVFADGSFISFDDAASITKKTQYALENGLMGVSAWELGNDRSAILLSAAYAALHGETG